MTPPDRVERIRKWANSPHSRWAGVSPDETKFLLTQYDTLTARVKELEAENARMREALVDISAGKMSCDNIHPLGEYASMVMRFMYCAKQALEGK